MVFLVQVIIYSGFPRIGGVDNYVSCIDYFLLCARLEGDGDSGSA